MEFLVFVPIIGLLLLFVAADGGDKEAGAAVEGVSRGVFLLIALAMLCAVVAIAAGVNPFVMAAGGGR